MIGRAPEIAYLIGGIILLMLAAEFAPKWAGWLLLVIVLGYLFLRQQKGGLLA